MKEVTAYSILAVGYDVAMEHVDYDLWAGHVHGLLLDYAPGAEDILELGCGTGSFALALRHIEQYRYVATDLVAQMVGVAQAKAEMEGAEIQFEQADFTDFALDQPVDVVLLLYDGLNYVLEGKDLDALFRCVFAALKPGGTFIFDQSTPSNSENNVALFEDRGEAEGFEYVRLSEYDALSRIHTTTFEIEALGEKFREVHLQRAYTIETLRTAVSKAGFVIEATFEDFGRSPANETSERVHWVVRRPPTNP